MCSVAISVSSSSSAKVPKIGVYDGEPAISGRRGKRLIYTEDYLRLEGHARHGLDSARDRATLSEKASWNAANGYLETKLMPGRKLCRP